MPSIIRATTTSGLQVAPDNSGSLELQTNGTTPAVTIDTSQNVGIGTTSPVGKLEVAAATDKNLNIDAGGIGSSLRLSAINDAASANVDLTVQALSTIFSSSGTERMRIDSSGYASGTVNGLGRGIYQSQQYYRLNSTVVGANATGAQSVFGVGVTLVGSTQYEFEIVYILLKTAGTTSHTLAFGFGGTATLNNIGYFYYGNDATVGLNVRAGGASADILSITTASSTVVTPANTSATLVVAATIKGTVSVNAGGTFIPQYSLSAAPGGAYTTQIGSYIKIAPLAASGANVSIGSWA